MISKSLARIFLAGIFAAAFILIAAPAQAQLGSMHGHVVDEAGKPVADADIVYDYVGEQKVHFTGKTDAKGEYNRGGLMLAGGRWNVTVTKGDLVGKAVNLDVPKGNALQVPDIVMHSKNATAAGGGGGKASSVDQGKVFNDVKALLAQNNFDAAITELSAATDKDAKCAQCFVRLGDTYYKKTSTETTEDLKKADLDNSEKAYLKAVDVNDKSSDAADAYGGLVTVYNEEKRFDDAGKMNDKATAILATSAAKPGATGGGGNDATSAYNAGVILWNQSKMPEAEAQFAKAIQMKPDMAEAHYYLGMCQINEGKMDDAKKSLQQYVKLAPTGPNAETAKSILDSLPK